MRRDLAAALAPWALAACAPSADEPAPGGAGPVAEVVGYEMRRVERSLGECDEPDARSCARVVLEFPELLSAPGGEDARRRIEAGLAEAAFRALGEEPGVVGPEALAQGLLDDYADFRAETPDPLGWTLERTAAVTLNTPEVFSLSVADYTFTGGAHPDSFLTLRSFDPKSGRRLGLSDLLRDGYEEPLRALAEARFREARGIGPDADLRAEGLWFEDGLFRPNDNFAVEPEGLRFHFDPYEIAPHAFGPTEVLLSRDELAGLARPGGPLAPAAAP